ncbi:PID-CTERM protein-sorting domain-containing protein [Persicobacter psychrovividus]|uniref:PEP-CTERM sorting domain-containing protein n=1 Tax=Persicobacter psychrovividus TaxID=387638 RepID=A0ABM7VCE6_9BACT|nr:hypothetical protein PEPS_08730 [Persicobacter psychrovividus]
MRLIFIFLFLFGLSFTGFCQEGNPDPPGNEIPIDGGISLLALGAGALGAYKLKKKKAEEEID